MEWVSISISNTVHFQHMGLKLDKKDISVSHRLPVSKKYNGSRREPGIIVKFVRRNSKDSFYKARRVLTKCEPASQASRASHCEPLVYGRKRDFL